MTMDLPVLSALFLTGALSLYVLLDVYIAGRGNNATHSYRTAAHCRTSFSADCCTKMQNNR